MPDTKPCDLPGCGAPIRRGMLMCREHWYSIPMPLRRDVNRTWRAYQAAQPPAVPFTEALGRLAAYRNARDAAIAAARKAIAL